jgi:hypothetical protein
LLCIQADAQVAIKAENLRIPVRLGLETSSKRVTAGEKLQVTVVLKNLQDQSVSATADVPVTLKFGDLESKKVVIPRGQSSTHIEFTAPRSGVLSIESTSPKLSPASSFLLVKPGGKPLSRGPASEASSLERVDSVNRRTSFPSMSRTTTAEAHEVDLGAAETAGNETVKGGKTSASREASGATIGELAGSRVAEPSAARPADSTGLAPPGSPASGQASQASKVEIYVEPNPVLAMQGKWAAQITLVLLTASGTLAEADRDLAFSLFCDVGKLNKRQVVIRAGDDSTLGQEISLTSETPGKDLLRVQSRLQPASREVVYKESAPTRLHMDAHPKEQISDGLTPVVVTVTLEDAEGHVAAADERDVKIVLTPSLGTMQPAQVIIPKGDFSSRASLTSSRPGDVTITAQAVGFNSAEATAKFLLPWNMVVLAGLGGLLGGIVYTLFKHKSIAWKGMWPNLLIGIIVGMIFYGLALFGVASVLKTGIDIDTSKLPTYNAIAALVLGFIGGLIVRMLWEALAKPGKATS